MDVRDLGFVLPHGRIVAGIYGGGRSGHGEG